MADGESAVRSFFYMHSEEVVSGRFSVLYKIYVNKYIRYCNCVY